MSNLTNNLSKYSLAYNLANGQKGGPSWSGGDAPVAPNFEDLNASNTQILDENGNVRDQYQSGFQSILPQYQSELDKIQLNTDALQKIREKALAPGDSAWLTLQKSNLQNNLADMRDSAVDQMGSGRANALSGLASSGGLGGGAAERVTRQTNSDFNKNRQEIARYGSTQENTLASTDEQQKNQLLSQLPGMEAQAIQPDIMKAQATLGQMTNEQQLGNQDNNYNINTALGELAQKRNFDLSKYQQQLTAYGADRTAFAEQNAKGGKGGGK